MTSHSRRLARLFCLLLAFSAAAQAADPVKTVIQDTIYRADGSVAAGTLVISWPAFVTADGKPVAAGSKVVRIGADGQVNIALVPTQGATPAGTYYKVVLQLNDGAGSQEYWSVPTLSPTTIAAIRSSVVPATVAMQVVSREYVDNALANVLHKGGDETLAGTKTFESSPLVPAPAVAAAAANKDYVDLAVAAFAGGPYPLALNKGGTAQNSWTAARCVRVANDGTKLESAATDCGSGAGAPGGSDMQLQFNDGGSFAGASTVTWNKTTKLLNSPDGAMQIGNPSSAPAIVDLTDPSQAGGAELSLIGVNNYATAAVTAKSNGASSFAGGYDQGLYSLMLVNPAADITSTQAGTLSQTELSIPTGVSHNGIVYGQWSAVDTISNSHGPVAKLAAQSSGVYATGSSVIDTAIGTEVQPTYFGAGTIHNNYGLYVGSQVGGTLHSYGIYLADMSAGGANDYAMYSAGGKSYFAGTVQSAAGFSGPLTGNASTATALAANGSNCSAGQAPRGVDAGGSAENCFAVATPPTGTGWLHVTAGVEDGVASTPTKSDIGLGNVTNDAQLKAADLDTDAAMAANSDARVASQKATAAYAAAKAIGSSSTTQLLYNSSGAVTGSANLAFDGTNLSIGVPARAANGTAAAPSYSFTNATGAGMAYIPAISALHLTGGGVSGGGITITNGNLVQGGVSGGWWRWSIPVGNVAALMEVDSAGGYTWSSTSDGASTKDTGLTRTAAGVVAVGNGASGDTSGTMKAAVLQSTAATGTAPFVVASTTEVANLHSATAGALAANGTNCAAGQAAQGVDASGNAEGCFTPAGGGTVTHTAGALTAGAMLIGNGAADLKVDTGCSTDGAGALTCASYTTTGSSADEYAEIAAPAAPAAGKGRAWYDSTDHRLHDKNSSNVIGTTVVADTGAASNFLTAISAAGVISKSPLAAADMPVASVIVTTSTPITVSTTLASSYYFNQHATAATGITYNLPAAAAGKQFCFANSYNGSAANTGVLTIATLAAGQYIIFTDGTLSASGGNITSGGAPADSACVVGVDATHWMAYVNRGTWAKH